MFKELALKTKDRKNASVLEKKLAQAVLDLNSENSQLRVQAQELRIALRNITQTFHNCWQKSKATMDKFNVMEEKGGR